MTIVTDELNASLVSALDKLVAGVESGVYFLSDELPEVVQQLVLWKTVTLSSYMVVALLTLVLSVLVFRHVRDVVSTASADWAEFMLLFSPVLGAGSLVSMVVMMSDLIMVVIAPKVWVLKYAAELIK